MDYAATCSERMVGVMKHMVLVSVIFAATTAMAEWSLPQVRYWANEQGITNDTSGIVVSADDGIESGWDAAWGEQPTIEQVEAIDYATARDWCRAQDKSKRDDSQSPDNGWSNLSKRERFLIRCMYRLAKLHYPELTLAQFRTQLRDEWDATPDNE